MTTTIRIIVRDDMQGIERSIDVTDDKDLAMRWVWNALCQLTVDPGTRLQSATIRIQGL